MDLREFNLRLRSFPERERPWFIELAACRGLDPDIFFPMKGDTKGLAKARAICEECPVLLDCQHYFTFESYEREGIFGGLSPKQRARLKNASKCA